MHLKIPTSSYRVAQIYTIFPKWLRISNLFKMGKNSVLTKFSPSQFREEFNFDKNLDWFRHKTLYILEIHLKIIFTCILSALMGVTFFKPFLSSHATKKPRKDCSIFKDQTFDQIMRLYNNKFTPLCVCTFNYWEFHNTNILCTYINCKSLNYKFVL